MNDKLLKDHLDYVKETPSKPKRGRPTEIKRDITKTSQSGLREGLTRATFIIREDTLDKLKERAYTDRKKLKDLVSEALDYYLDNHKETKFSRWSEYKAETDAHNNHQTQLQINRTTKNIKEYNRILKQWENSSWWNRHFLEPYPRPCSDHSMPPFYRQTSISGYLDWLSEQEES